MILKRMMLRLAAARHAQRALKASQWLADHQDYELPGRIWANFRLAERTIYWVLDRWETE